MEFNIYNMENNKIIKFNEYKEEKTLSDDIEIIDIENDEKIDFKEFEIEHIIDVILPEDLEQGNSIEEAITTHVDGGGKDYKRGDTIYISAMIRKKGTSSFNSPSRTAVLKCRITDIFFGLKYLNKVIN
jgi:hypothetical protein